MMQIWNLRVLTHYLMLSLSSKIRRHLWLIMTDNTTGTSVVFLPSINRTDRDRPLRVSRSRSFGLLPRMKKIINEYEQRGSVKEGVR